MHIDYFQIGAHIGDTSTDHIFNILPEKFKAILIEPVPYLFKQLQINYRSKYPNAELELLNAAVSNKDGILPLYVPSESNDFDALPHYITQLASTVEGHIEFHAEEAGLDRNAVLIDKCDIQCYRLNTLIEKYNITSIEYLYVDTEGHDYDILMDFNMNKLKPINIIFENKHMDGFATKGPRYAQLVEHFCTNGYKVISETYDDTHMQLI
jgi:FkbM family methyltransferase